MRFTTAIALLLTATQGLALPAADNGAEGNVLVTRGPCKCRCVESCRSRCIFGGTPGSAVGQAACISGCRQGECGCSSSEMCTD